MVRWSQARRRSIERRSLVAPLVTMALDYPEGRVQNAISCCLELSGENERRSLLTILYYFCLTGSRAACHSSCPLTCEQKNDQGQMVLTPPPLPPFPSPSPPSPSLSPPLLSSSGILAKCMEQAMRITQYICRQPVSLVLGLQSMREVNRSSCQTFILFAHGVDSLLSGESVCVVIKL